MNNARNDRPIVNLKELVVAGHQGPSDSDRRPQQDPSEQGQGGPKLLLEGIIS